MPIRSSLKWMMELLFVLAEKAMIEFHCILESFLFVEVVHIELNRTRILLVWWRTKSLNVWSIWARLQNREEFRLELGKSCRPRTRLGCLNLWGLGGCPMFFRWSSILYFFSFFYGNFKHILKKRKNQTLSFWNLIFICLYLFTSIEQHNTKLFFMIVFIKARNSKQTVIPWKDQKLIKHLCRYFWTYFNRKLNRYRNKQDWFHSNALFLYKSKLWN